MVVTKPLPPMHRVVTEAELSKALDFLRDSSAELGNAKGDVVKSERYVQHVEALEMCRSEAKSADMRKAEARCSKLWKEATDHEAIAVAEFTKLQALREAAAAKIESWRTEQANFRAMKI